MKKEILKQLKSDYERLEIKPSADLWAKLDQELDGNPETAVKPSFQWWKYAAVALLLISAGTFIFYSSRESKPNHKTDYIVKKTLEQVAKPVNSDTQDLPVHPNEEPVQENEIKIVSKSHEKVNSQEVLTPAKKVKPQSIETIEYKEPQIAVKQPEKITQTPEKTEISTANLPVIAEVKQTKTSYISTDDLLLGNEYDKNRAKAAKNDKKVGTFNFDRMVPNVGNVTVLGVTVYIDSK